MDATADMDVANGPTAPPAAESLPRNLGACHAMIGQLLNQNHDLRRNNSQLEHQLEQLLRKLYGRSSEKLDPNQLALFAELLGQLQSQPPAPQTPAIEPASIATAAKPVKTPHTPHGRRRFPDDLPRQRIEHDLPEEQKPCPCCGNARCKIGEEVTEKLEYVPAKVIVLQNVQFKYACTHCESQANNPQITLAEKPLDPIEKGMAGPGLLAYVIVGKYSDHLPLHRLEKILARHNIDIARSTMCDWAAGCANALRPLYDLMVSMVLKSKVMHTDDTPVDVLDRNRNQTRTGRFWIYLGDKEHPCTVFQYTSGRSGDGPMRFLAGWGKEQKVYLQADAFSGYDRIYAVPAIHAPTTDAPMSGAPAAVVSATPPILSEQREQIAAAATGAMLAAVLAATAGVIEVACWAHARRKFYEARNSDPARSAQAMAYIRLLYDVEDQAKEKQLDPAARAALRQQMALPRLIQFKVWLETSGSSATTGGVLPKSPMGQAITYTLNQ